MIAALAKIALVAAGVVEFAIPMVVLGWPDLVARVFL